MKLNVALFGFLFLCAFQTLADDKELDEYLRQFEANPARRMDAPLIKRDDQGKIIKSDSLFSTESIRTQSFVEAKDELRKKMCTQHHGVLYCLDQEGRASILGNDRVENLVDSSTKIIRNLNAMENLKSATLSTLPWSDSYWPLARGQLARRYADSSYSDSWNWQSNYNFFLKHPPKDSQTEDLSPAEKYDLLMGDKQWNLTQSQWERGKRYLAQYGKIERWVGICEGWAGAAISLNEPVQVVETFTADGRKLRWYPSDIKALASQIWATGTPPVHFVGGRCGERHPPKDSNGRIKSQACFDTNPGTWHMGIVNQLGVAKRYLIMDAVYDFEVWNQPVYAYEFKYFNPQTHKSASSWQEATIEKSQFTKDKFKTYRSPSTQTVVGVLMTVRYIVENNPSHAVGSSRNTRQVRYTYDLEIDKNGNIIGGEWYTNKHPDFLWAAPRGARATSIVDGGVSLTQWNTAAAVPAFWSSVAPRASVKAQPIAAVVERLIQLAQ